MEEARINIEVIDDGENISVDASLEGTRYLLTLGLVDAIKKIENNISLEYRNKFRLEILKLLLNED